jgi:hypothetical protein
VSNLSAPQNPSGQPDSLYYVIPVRKFNPIANPTVLVRSNKFGAVRRFAPTVRLRGHQALLVSTQVESWREAPDSAEFIRADKNSRIRFKSKKPDSGLSIATILPSLDLLIRRKLSPAIPSYLAPSILGNLWRSEACELLKA